MKEIGQHHPNKNQNLDELSQIGGSVFAKERLNSQSQFLAKQGSTFELDFSHVRGDLANISDLSYTGNKSRGRDIPAKKIISHKKALFPNNG